MQAKGLIHPAFTISIMMTSQITVGMLAFQKYLYKAAEHDAWISVLATGVCAHFVIYLIFRTLAKFEYKSLYDIHRQLFGKWFGSLLNAVLICYWILVSMYVLRNYIEVLLIWIFPEIHVWVFDIMFFVLIAYGLSGGIRVISTVSVIHLLLLSWLVLLLYYPLKEADFRELLPVMQAGADQIFGGMLAMGATIGGFDVVFFTSSRMSKPHRIHRYAQFALLSVNLLYLAMMLLSLGYYSGKQIENNSWGTLTMLKVIEFTFLERFEYIVIMMWFILVLANLMISSWVIIQGVTRIVPLKRKYVFALLCALLLVVTQAIRTGDQLAVLSKLISDCAIVFSFAYPFLLSVIVLLLSGVRRRRKGAAA